nr:MAG TPA: protein of unknown function (DUF4406) [Caudoviricetes sp.]
MNIYISIPRRGSKKAFIKRVHEIIRVLQGQYKNGSDFYYPICSPKERLKRLDLGLSITRLLLCDGAHFTQGWEQDKACQIEHEICKAYDIKILKD